jgi:hypothetical protein
MVKSKQAKAKEAQGYNPKPIPQTCCNCACFKYEFQKIEYPGGMWTKETSLRCTRGGFAVKKTATCDEFEFPY